MAFGNSFIGRGRDVPLVRPYVIRAQQHPERAPADAVPPSLDVRCDRCPAAPLVVLWRVVTESVPLTEGAWPWAGAGVLELQLCGHHATAYETLTDDQDWRVVLDRRQHTADAERR